MSIATSLMAILLVVSVIVVVVAATLIYRAFYQSRINRQLNDESLRPRKRLSPWAFSLIIIFAVLLILAGLAIYLIFHDEGERVPDEYFNAIYDYQTYDSSQMTNYRSAYSIENNPGYTKRIEQKNDVRFTYFMRDDAFDYYHPAFIVFIEYTGDKHILYYGVEGDFFIPTGLRMSGKGHAGAPFQEYFCILGTSTVECTFELTAYFYDGALKGENMGDYAAAEAALTLAVPAK